DRIGRHQDRGQRSSGGLYRQGAHDDLRRCAQRGRWQRGTAAAGDRGHRMTQRPTWRAALLALPLAAAASLAVAQGLGGLGAAGGDEPLLIDARDGIEWYR